MPTTVASKWHSNYWLPHPLWRQQKQQVATRTRGCDCWQWQSACLVTTRAWVHSWCRPRPSWAPLKTGCESSFRVFLPCFQRIKAFYLSDDEDTKNPKKQPPVFHVSSTQTFLGLAASRIVQIPLRSGLWQAGVSWLPWVGWRSRSLHCPGCVVILLRCYISCLSVSQGDRLGELGTSAGLFISAPKVWPSLETIFPASLCEYVRK